MQKQKSIRSIIDNPYNLTRWSISVILLFLGMLKAKALITYGLEPYRAFSTAIGWPALFQYYGVLAMLIELTAGAGVWNKNFFSQVIILMSILTLGGLFLGVYSLLFKFNSECGCGLLGENEFGLLAQKILILTALIFLLKGKERLFINKS